MTPEHPRRGTPRAWWRRPPLCVLLAVAAWVVAVAAGGPGRPPTGWATGVAALAAGRWWSVLTSALWWGGPTGYLVTSVLLLVLGVFVVERTVGRWWCAGLLLGAQVLGVTLTLGAAAAVATLGGRWAETLAGQQAVGAGPAILGAAAAVSTRLSALRRRRLRILLVTVSIMLVAYSGQLTDVVLLVSTLLGLLAGRWLLGHEPRRAGRASGPEARVLLALLVAVSAVGPLVAVVARTPIGPLSVLRYVVLPDLPDAATVQRVCASGAAADCRALRAQQRLAGVGSGLAGAVPMLLLLVVAEGLRRGRRAAWAVGIALNLVLTALGIALAVVVASTPDAQLVVYRGAVGAQEYLGLVLPPMLPLLIAVLLLVSRRYFGVAAPPGTYRRLLGVCGAALALVVAGYLVIGRAVADQFDRPPSLAALLADLPARFLPPGYLGEVEPPFLPQGPVATLVFEWTGPVFWLVVVLGLLRAFRTPRVESSTAAASAARELLVARGGSTLAWMTTWAGNAHWIAPNGAAAVAYRVVGSVALSVGDPVGAVPDRVAAVEPFAAYCRERGWSPAFYSVTGAIRDRCLELGWSAVQVAEETVLDLPGLAFTGRRWQDVRTALNRAARAGITAEWMTFATAPRQVTDQIRAISEDWVADRGLPEMGFTLGGLDELTDPQVRCLVAVDAERTVHAVTSWLPVYRDGQVVGRALDLMRRRASDGFRPVMEFLIASAAQDLRDSGHEVLSLSGAPLARLDRGQAPTGLQRTLDLVADALEPLYGFRSLLAFKAKFQPRYEPLHLAFPDPAALPAIGIALGHAYLPHLDARSSARLLVRLRGRRD